jgi:hypothetical protein
MDSHDVAEHYLSGPKFGQAQIELLKEKLSVVVDAFSAERTKIAGDFSAMAYRYSCDIAERDYSIATTALELTNAR